MSADHKRFWLTVAAYYQYDLNETQLKLFAEDTAGISVENLRDAFDRYREQDRYQRFPFPPALIRIAMPQDTPIDNARLASIEIWNAIGRYGWNNPDQARVSMGSLAWLVVERSGGWRRLCEESGHSDAGIMRAQLRDIAESLHRKSERGELHRKADLPDGRVAKIADGCLRAIDGEAGDGSN